ncbi:MAG: uroporphyrinogen decarboxylase [Actinomycetota bacterium]|jgi:uroporphyrinogen decarboxylase|nr:uroporphyrinogen decarboxylase [Actinomycetota bacterium]
MRQAGRSLPEYRELREKHSILEMCSTPELAAQATLQPVTRLGVDAAILFSDIVVPLRAMGIDLDIKPGVGPVISNPIRTLNDVDALLPLDPEGGVGYVLDAIRILVRELEVPLIGFAGAPFTLASYLIEGGPSRTFARTKSLMLGEPETWNKLMDRLSESVLAYLRAQVGAGAQAIQLFDSWVGALAPAEYLTYVAPGVERIFGGLEDLSVPRIHFGVGTGELLGSMASVGADVVGVDWRVPLGLARTRVGTGVSLQGNLDPAICLAPWHVVEEHAIEVLNQGGGTGHIFNLGHGVLPETDPAILEKLVELVHTYRP